MWFFFFFQAEDGIRDLVRSRGLGDVYKRQALVIFTFASMFSALHRGRTRILDAESGLSAALGLSLIHI